MLLRRDLNQAEVAANHAWTGSLHLLCVRNLLNPQPWCALLFNVCAGCIFQQPLSSRGLCFIKCVSASHAEVHSATVCLAVAQPILWHFGKGWFLGFALLSFTGICVLTS